MKQIKTLVVMIAMLFPLAVPAAVMARGIDPVVSTEWLEKNLMKPQLVIVDIRKVEEYKAGHIPGAINIFYNIWAPGKGDMQNELPAADDLEDTLSENGIGADSLVVIAGKTDAPPDRVNTTRVAMTLIYAGVVNVAVLDGGITKWGAENRKVSTEVVKAKPKEYKGKVNKGILITKDELMGKLGKVTVVDTREPDFYNGTKKLDFVARPGHIKGAVNLPTMSQVFNPDGTYKNKADLLAMAEKAVGKDLGKEIVIYCDSGRVASAWWYLLREFFGYRDVKLYDGSAQEWAKDPAAPME